MITLRRVKALVLGHDLSADATRIALEASSVPIADVDCRTCPEPCTDDHDPYPTRFDVDRETLMLGSVRPYCRQIILSTGKADWDRDISHTAGSLAQHLSHVQSKRPAVVISGSPTASVPFSSSPPKRAAGVFESSESRKIDVLNGSHKSLSSDGLETVLVFPDFKVITDVSPSLEGAETLWDTHLDPSLGRGGAFVEKSPFSTWVLPYSCVILLCSHKRRDNRCHIAAGKLEAGQLIIQDIDPRTQTGTAFSHHLTERSWTVHTELEHPMHSGHLPLEAIQGTEEDQEDLINRQLSENMVNRRALILKNSHTGGHRYAGNCIIYTPTGSGVWYGRVSTHEVEAIVAQTLEEGLILAPLLRGGINITRKPGCARTLNDW